MENLVSVKVQIGGSEIAAHKITQITVEQRHNWHSSFEIRANLDDVLSGSSKSGYVSDHQNYIGKDVYISIESADGKNTKHSEFKGIVTDLNIVQGIETNDALISGYSPTIKLDGLENTRCFTDKSFSDIVKSVTGDVSLSPKVGGTNPKYEFMVQYRENDYAFITRLAEETGNWFYHDGTDLHIGKLNVANSLDAKLHNDLLDVNFGMHLKPLKFKSTAYDYINNSVVDFQPSSITGLDSFGQDMKKKSENLYTKATNVVPYQKVKNQSELKDFSNAKYAAPGAGLTTISGLSLNPKIKMGSKINVKGNGDESFGSYIITSITHTISGLNGYEGKFEGMQANIMVPPSNPNASYPVCETQIAVVTDNDDPDKIGRIKVKLKAHSDVDTPWIRVVNHHAGKGKGFQFIPEVDDEVLVAFEQGNVSRPYVMGSLYNGKAKHDDRSDSDNLVKTIRTKSGNEIKFFDKDGEEEILIHNKDSQNHITLSLKDDGKITIKSKNKMELLAKEILIEAEDKLTMKSKETILEGKDKVDINTNKDCKIKSSDTTIETQKNLTMKAGVKAELKATAGLDIDGGPKTSVKSSAMLELEGGAMAKLKGGMVMIN